jgi:hypothetical protein
MRLQAPHTFATVPRASIATAFFVCALSLLNCSSTSSTTADAGTDAPAVRPEGDAAPEFASWCEALGAKMDRCAGMRECAAGFPMWCPEQSKTNSLAFETAEKKCLRSSCEQGVLSDCRYKTYASLSQTQVQKNLVKAYCASCGAGDATCESVITSYNAAVGAASVTDAFVAAWEFSDELTTEITMKCTGAALMLDAGDCAKTFGGCAADVYLARVPSCP